MLVPNRRQAGVTLVEMVMVISISALIIAGIMLTVPAVQRGQRNDARRRDITYVQSQLLAFSFATDGALPANATEMVGAVTSVGAESAYYSRIWGWSNVNNWHETLSTATSGTTKADKYDIWIDDGTPGTANDDTDPGFAGGTPPINDPLPDQDHFDVFIGFRCQGKLLAGPNYAVNGNVHEEGAAGDFAIVYKLEGDDFWYCASNNSKLW